jgi:hypothetical protein
MGPWLARLDAEVDNLRAALETGLTAEPEAAVRLAVALAPYWDFRGLFREGADWLERGLATGAATGRLRAAALAALGRLVHFGGQFRDARPWLEQAIAACRESHDDRLLASVVGTAALCATMMGDLEDAGSLCGLGLQLTDGLGDRAGRLGILTSKAHLAMLAGTPAEAAPALHEGLQLASELGDRRLQSRMLADQGLLAWFAGDPVEARAKMEAGLTLADGLVDHFTMHYIRWLLSLVAIMEGRLDDARLLLVDAMRLERISRDAYGLPFALESMALVHALSGRPEPAARLLGAAEALREVTGSPLPLPSRPMHETALQAIRAGAGEAAVLDAWAAGRAMTSSEALAYALGEWDPEAPQVV